MNDFGTTVMLVGRTPPPAGGLQLEPLWRTNFMNPPPTSPAQPQNLLRPTFMNGAMEWAHGATVGSLGRVMRRGVPGVTVGGLGSVFAKRPHVGDARVRRQVGIGDVYAPPAPRMTEAQWSELTNQMRLWSLVGTVGMVAGIYHGWKRTKGSGWGTAWWGLLGGIFPVPTTAVAFAQGFAKPKRGR